MHASTPGDILSDVPNFSVLLTASSHGESIMSEERTSFTLRDLVVAAAVVGFLCLFVPYLLVAEPHGGGRRSTCLSNQHNISLALIQYAERHQHYPGYANTLAQRTTSYVVPILPYIERNDVYQAWNQPDGTTAHQQALVYMNVLVCPSNVPTNTAGTPNAFVINAGMADPPADISPAMIEAGGIATDLTLADPVLVSLQYVTKHDGASGTLLLSENLQGQSWAITAVPQLYTGTTFLWWNNPPTDTRDYRINQGKTPPPNRRDIIYCRPSSNHPGGVNVAFCGGNVRFLAEDIDYDVYKQLMTPNGAVSGDSVNRNIKDGDY
jgi:prepilin-type processing-associated H-X9-DG protein